MASFLLTADEFNVTRGASPWGMLFALAVLAALSMLAMLLTAPVGWSLSALVSALMRRRVPRQYRQRGRNMAPLKGACLAVGGASILGATHGGAGAAHWVPSIRDSAKPVADYALAHMEPQSRAYAYLAQLMQPKKPVTITAPSSNDTYREIQQRLILLGYLRGPADDKLNKATRQAMGRYLRDKHLKANLSPRALLAYMRQP